MDTAGVHVKYQQGSQSVVFFACTLSMCEIRSARSMLEMKTMIVSEARTSCCACGGRLALGRAEKRTIPWMGLIRHSSHLVARQRRVERFSA